VSVVGKKRTRVCAICTTAMTAEEAARASNPGEEKKIDAKILEQMRTLSLRKRKALERKLAKEDQNDSDDEEEDDDSKSWNDNELKGEEPMVDKNEFVISTESHLQRKDEDIGGANIISDDDTFLIEIEEEKNNLVGDKNPRKVLNETTVR